MKILVIKFRHIGDTLLLTPLLENLKLSFPEAKIDVAINRGTQEMLTLNPNINRLFIYDREYIKSQNIFKRLYLELKFALSIKRERYDIVINTTNGDRGLFLAIGAKEVISYRSKKNFLLNYFITKEIEFKKYRHIVEAHLEAIRLLNKEPKSARVSIFWDKEVDLRVEKLLAKHNLKGGVFIHIHPFSRWMFKCVDDEIMADIIDYCQKRLNLRVVLTSAPIKEELDRLKSILSYCKSEPINLSGKLSLKEISALNKRAKFFIGVDTAIMHISASNDTPTLALFGPSGAYNWGPWDNSYLKSGYIKQNGVQSMGKHLVIQVDWECAPCYKDGCNGSKISDCLMKKGLNSKLICSYIDKFNSKI